MYELKKTMRIIRGTKIMITEKRLKKIDCYSKKEKSKGKHD